MLDAVGVTPAQTRCYEQLLATRALTAAQLANQLDLSPPAVSEHLDGLVSLGLVSATAEAPARYVPAPPEVAVGALVQQRREHLERTRLYAARLTVAYRDCTVGDAVRYVEVVHGRDAVTQRFQQLQRSATDEVLVFVKPPYLGDHEHQERTERTLLDKGVRVRGLYDRAAIEETGGLDNVTRLFEQGEEARVLPDVPMKLAIADRRLALVALAPEQPDGDSAILVHPCGLLEALNLLAENMWRQAAPITPGDVGVVASGGPTDLDERDREILQLLQAGLTDASIARQLRIAERTVGRRLRRLMDRAGAHTRFQLGWRAAEAGWLGETATSR